MKDLWKKTLPLILSLAVLFAGCGQTITEEKASEIPAEAFSDIVPELPVPVSTDAALSTETNETEAQEETEETEETESEETEETESGETESEEPETEFTPSDFKAKGIYITAWAAGTPDIMEEMLSNMEGTELNTVVIDVKDDEGRIVFETDSPYVTETEAVRVCIGDFPALVKECHDRGLYVIGRLVCFRDPYIWQKKPEWVLKTQKGEVYLDKKDNAWIDPANKEAKEYLFEVAKDCVDAGVDEIQFDYVRYPAVVDDAAADVDGETRQNSIITFAREAREYLHGLGIPCSLDVFGTIVYSDVDRGIIGQNYSDLSMETDYLCPMIYPSHFADGTFGIDHPDTKPGETVYECLMKSGRIVTGKEGQAIVRPWLQDFTADYLEHYIEYGPKAVREQIESAYTCELDQWLIWDPTGNYSWDAFEKVE